MFSPWWVKAKLHALLQYRRFQIKTVSFSATLNVLLNSWRFYINPTCISELNRFWMKLSGSEMPATHHPYSPTWMKLSGSEMPFLHQPKPYLKDQFLKCPLSHQPYSPTWMRRSGSEKPLLRIPPCSLVGSPSKIHNCYRAWQEKIYNKNLKGWGKKWHSGRRVGEVISQLK